jgi:hypothetical protein
MRALFMIVGAVILVAGIACLIHPRWASPASKKEVDIDNHKVIFETTKYTEIPKPWSVVAVLLGGALVFVGSRKS